MAIKMENNQNSNLVNVLGQPLEECRCEPITGWYRDGFCRTDITDVGQHTICCVMTEGFLAYSKAQGNDLTTPREEFGFPGLVADDHWCRCASRWYQAYLDGMAPSVRLNSTHIRALEIIDLNIIKEHKYSL